jgi:hypothetical protein
MNNYTSIKELVIDTYVSEGCMPNYEKLTSLVKQYFPNSRWKESHYAWYKSAIKTGKISLPGVTQGTHQEDDADEINIDIEESIDARVSLERDIHDYLASRLDELESGLSLNENGIEYQTDAGRIDLLATDDKEQLVVIEVKAGKARDSALGQLLGYIGCVSYQQDNDRQVRGILVAADFDSRVIYACKNLSNMTLFKYKLNFSFSEIA